MSAKQNASPGARSPDSAVDPLEIDTTIKYPDASQAEPPVPVAKAADSAMQAAQRIGRYAVLRKLGEGGMGMVLAAYDEELDRRVAVKLLHDRSAHDAEQRLRILREAQAMARLSHPNVVQVYEVGEHGTPAGGNSQIFIAMEFIDGMTLYDWQRQPGRSWEDILRLYVAAGQGLLAAHQSGLVHRDFKPDNVLVGQDGRPRVADFGLARSGESELQEHPVQRRTENLAERSSGRLLTSPLTLAGAVMGTPMYMSPEQYQGKLAGPQSDLFSFCVALYEALYSVLPFEGATFEALRASVLLHRLRPQPKGTAVPLPIYNAIVRGLAADPAQRFTSMKELLAALAFDPVQNPAALPLSRRLFSAILIAITAVLVAIFLGPTLRSQNTARMAMISTWMLFLSLGLATLILRKTLLRNSFHSGIVILILSLSGQEALISTAAYQMDMTVAQIVAMDLTALVAISVTLTYFFFRRGWLCIPIVLAAMAYVVHSPPSAGLVALLVHALYAAGAIWLWSLSAESPRSGKTAFPSKPLS